MSQNWTEHQKRLLTEMWAQGKSAQVISDILRFFSRSAVIGKVHRLGLARRETTAAKTRVVKINKRRVARKVHFNFKEPEVIIAPDAAHRCTFEQLTDTSCRYPLWNNDSENKFYCGSPLADMAVGRAWCPFHRRIVYGRNASAA